MYAQTTMMIIRSEIHTNNQQQQQTYHFATLSAEFMLNVRG